MAFSEREIILVLGEIFASSNPGVEVGIGDDAAVIATSRKSVFTTDMAVEGIHFRKDWSSAFEIGRKITAANLADVFAMGAKPTYLVVALSLTGDEELEWIKDLAEGILYEANLVGASVVGGDLAKGVSVTIAISALGEVDKPILRSGAQIGDGIYLSNLPGWSRAGLEILSRGLTINSELAERAILAFKAPRVRYEYLSQLIGATALLDLSDSLATQSGQLAASSEVSLVFEVDLFKAAPDYLELAELAEMISVSVEDLILGGGEDHCFLATGLNLAGLYVGRVEIGNAVTFVGNEKAPDTWRHFQ